MAANDPAQQHSNLIERQLDLAQVMLVTADPRTLRDWLFEARLAHPLDSHPTNSQRADALGVDMDAVLREVLRDIRYPIETEPCSELEQEITFLELKFGAQGEGRERGGPPREIIPD